MCDYYRFAGCLTYRNWIRHREGSTLRRFYRTFRPVLYPLGGRPQSASWGPCPPYFAIMWKLKETKVLELTNLRWEVQGSNQAPDLSQESRCKSKHKRKCPWADWALTWQAFYPHHDMATYILWASWSQHLGGGVKAWLQQAMCEIPDGSPTG